MSVTGLARHLVRLLAREGHGVESVLGRLNVAMAEESAEAFALGAEQTGSRFLSLLYGELTVDPGVPGARCTVATAGHPPPLHLCADGRVEPASVPQMLLGIDEGAEFRAATFDLAPGETLLCVTDGVTERRCGNWQLDDNDGLADVLRQGMGLSAKALAEHVRRAAHDFGTGPVEDDLSVLVLQAVAGRKRVRGGPEPRRASREGARSGPSVVESFGCRAKRLRPPRTARGAGNSGCPTSVGSTSFPGPLGGRTYRRLS